MKDNFRNITHDVFSLETTHLEKADETSYLIVIIGSVLAALVLLGTGVAIFLFLVYRPRKKGMTFPLYRHRTIKVHWPGDSLKTQIPLNF